MWAFTNNSIPLMIFLTSIGRHFESFNWILLVHEFNLKNWENDFCATFRSTELIEMKFFNRVVLT